MSEYRDELLTLLQERMDEIGGMAGDEPHYAQAQYRWMLTVTKLLKTLTREEASA